MTYQELLNETAKKKEAAIKEINEALNGKMGFLVKAELEKKTGNIAWEYLGREFCETLAEHIEEFIQPYSDDFDSIESREIFGIYTAYEDGDPDIYQLLPVEARLFDN